MKKILVCFALAAGMCFAQYKTEPAGSAPDGLAPALASMLQQPGAKVVNGSGATWCEVWFQKQIPSGPKSDEQAVAFPAIPQGAFLGVIRFPAKGADRRGQTIKPGVYTMRYGLYPDNGDHQGVAPQRDFLVLVPAALDTDPNALPKYDALVDLSRKASGTPHPAVFEIGPPAGDAALPSLTKSSDHDDWFYNVKIGDLPMAVILVGKSAA
jgi:hypothetical protein